MASKLILEYNGNELACEIEKVDRSKIYGYRTVEVLDDEKNACELATLAADGKTIIGSGGSSFAYFSPDGEWMDKKELTPVDLDGNEIEPVTSSFKQTTALKDTVTVDEYLTYNVRSVYLIEAEDGFDSDLLDELKDGKIYKFEFSYRGGLEPDTAFLLQGPDGSTWMALGKPTDIRFIGFEQAAMAAAEDEDDDAAGEESDLMDFGMM